MRIRTPCGHARMLTDARFRGRLVRVMAPRWAHDPLGGAGAAKNGGRYNRVDRAALYLSTSLDVAVNEYQQDTRFRPATFVAYAVDVGPVADVTIPVGIQAHGDERDGPFSSWKDARDRGDDPVTWRIADRPIEAGFSAALVPSVLPANRPPTRATQGVNMVVWRWNTTPDSSVLVLDPMNDLPRDATSWR